MANILIVPDSFKGCMTSTEVADIIALELTKTTNKSIKRFPIADGGEGSVDCILNITGGTKHKVCVKSPEHMPIYAEYGITNTNIAIIEFAESSGITKQTSYQTKKTSSYGFGEQILDALNNGVRDFILCLGGSATTDAACGMAAALGVNFTYDDGNSSNEGIIPAGELLSKITNIDFSNLDNRISQSHFTVMCDVENPLYGPNGAAYVYGPQKGATDDDLVLLDSGLQHVCELINNTINKDYGKLPGGGAAGGAGFGCVAFLNAKLESGIDLILNLCNFDEEIKDCELIITGEGKLDRQSLMGKVLSGLRRHSNDIPIISFCGICELDKNSLSEANVTAYEIGRGLPLNEAMANAKENLKNKAQCILIKPDN